MVSDSWRHLWLLHRRSVEVVQYFKRTLTGKKAGSKVNVIASEEKKKVFVYKLTKGQLFIAFHFGEWNTYGFP